MAGLSMLSSIWTKLGDIVAGFFAIIPQSMYFLYASIASILDMFQFIFRKIAGLDVYYVNNVEKSGDLVVNLIEGLLGINKEYSALSTVFWSMIIFGVIVLILMTIFTIIKAHYNYDAKKSSPSYIIKSTLKSLATMAIIPLCTLLGLYLGSAIFKTLDSITSVGSTQVLSGTYDAEAIQNFAYATTNISSTAESGDTNNQSSRRYASYDFFGAKEWSSSQTFSGVMFEACANSANRVRSGSYQPNGSGWDNADVFYTSSTANIQETVAYQIDYAFSNNLTLANSHTVQIAGYDEASAAIASSLTYGPSAGFAAGLINVKSFSKYNVGLVWYYYNLWSFNFILAFAGIFICLTLFSNILFGMLMRIIMVAVLFIVYPPIVGLIPFDEGNGTKTWRKEFISYLISAYSSVIAMNILFLLLPVFNSIKFFNISLLDGIVKMLILFAGLSMVRRFIALISSFVGAKNIDDLGQGLKKESSTPIKRAVNAGIGVGVAAVGFKKLTNAIGQDIKESNTLKKIANSKPVKAIEKGLSSAKAKFLNSKLGKFGSEVKKAATEKVVQIGTKFSKAGQKVKKGLNKALDNSAVKFVASRLGIPVDPHHSSEYAEVEETVNGKTVKVTRHIDGYDENEKPIYGKKKESGLAIIKNGILDLSRVALKAVGDITGLKGMVDNFAKDNKMLDKAKQEVNEFAKTILGIKGPVFQTKKDAEEKERKEALTKQPLNIGLNASVSTETLREINSLLNDIKKS